jgi:uncharacterized protein (TIGR02001 family)
MKQMAVGVVTGLLLFGARESAAQEAGGPASWFSGNVAITSDYPFRGISQTLRKPAIQGGVDATVPVGLYAGVWGSSLNFGEDVTAGPRAQVELDFYGGFVRELVGASWQIGMIYYAYPGAAASRSYNYLEVNGSVGRDVGVGQAKASFAYCPDFFAGSGTAAHVLGEVTIPLVSVFSVGLAVGHQTIRDHAVFGADDYTYWQAPISAELPGFKLSVAYVGTNLNRAECFAGSNLCEGRAVFSLSRSR